MATDSEVELPKLGRSLALPIAQKKNGWVSKPCTPGDSQPSVPIFDKSDVYEVFDDKQLKKPNSMVATVRGKRLEHDGPIRFGGVLRKLDFEDKTQKTHQYFLETLFYSKL